jgi:molybdopterin molybdotransferase
MISLEKAQLRTLALCQALPPETLHIDHCAGRYLAADLTARRTQPAADLSAMDGYAVHHSDLSAQIEIIGESAAGRPFPASLAAGQGVRIFTGAHVPECADTVVMQEDTNIERGMLCVPGWAKLQTGAHIRRTGSDFVNGQTLLKRGQILHAGAIAAAVMGGYGALTVGSLPRVAIIGSGDELIAPGHPAGPAQIPASNNSMLLSMLNPLPCEADDMGIAADNMDALQDKFAECSGYDIIVCTGGASVGDHDLVQAALVKIGAEIDFWRIAVKPGKPMMAGKLGGSVVLGLPGNPGSAFVTAHLFLLPLVRYLAGSIAPFSRRLTGVLETDLPENREREEYLRAVIKESGIATLSGQDSGLTAMLAIANALLIRPPFAPKAKTGEKVPYILL